MICDALSATINVSTIPGSFSSGSTVEGILTYILLDSLIMPVWNTVVFPWLKPTNVTNKMDLLNWVMEVTLSWVRGGGNAGMLESGGNAGNLCSDGNAGKLGNGPILPALHQLL